MSAWACKGASCSSSEMGRLWSPRFYLSRFLGTGFRLVGGRTFFCFTKRKQPKKRRPRVTRSALPTSLRNSKPAGAAELGLRSQTVLALCPPASPLLGAAHGALRSKAIPPAPRPTSRHSRVGGNLGGAWIPAYAGMTVQPLQLTSQQIAAVDLEKRQKIKTPHRTRTPCRAPWAALSNAGDREISACLFFAYFLLAKQKKVRRQQGGNPGQVTGIAIKTSRRHQHETHHPR